MLYSIQHKAHSWRSTGEWALLYLELYCASIPARLHLSGKVRSVTNVAVWFNRTATRQEAPNVSLELKCQYHCNPVLPCVSPKFTTDEHHYRVEVMHEGDGQQP